MTIYSFRIKKGKYQLDLVTTDKVFVSEQFEVWVKHAGAYAKKAKAKECKELVQNQIKAEEEQTKRNIEAHLTRSKENQASMQETKKTEEVKKDSTPKADSKVEKALDIFFSPTKKTSISEIVNHGNPTGVFDNLLENSMNNPKTELTFKPSPSIKKDNAFLNYINSRKIERKIDYLLLTAYYFTQYEQKPRFTLKQLNAKLMQNIAVIIDHGVLQEAINRDYIECLPDLTGLVGSSEYRLTAYGEKVLLDE